MVNNDIHEAVMTCFVIGASHGADKLTRATRDMIEVFHTRLIPPVDPACNLKRVHAYHSQPRP